MDFKHRWEGRVSSHSWVEIQLNTIKSEAIHSCIPCNAFCYLVILYVILQYFVWLLTISVLTVLTTLFANSLWTLKTSMQTALTQTALTHKGQAALWVTNGCTSMSKPVIIWSTPMGVDNNMNVTHHVKSTWWSYWQLKRLISLHICAVLSISGFQLPFSTTRPKKCDFFCTTLSISTNFYNISNMLLRFTYP